MRTSLKALVTLSTTIAGIVAFAAAAQAGDVGPANAASGIQVPATMEAVEYGGDCGFSSAHLQAQIDAAEHAEKAKVRAGIEALLEPALAVRKTAAATPAPGKGS